MMDLHRSEDLLTKPIKPGELQIFWRSFITSIYLAVVETILYSLILLVIDGISKSWQASTVDGNYFLALLNGCALILVFRLMFGFTIANCLVWWALAQAELRFSLAILCVINKVVVLLMCCVWNLHVEIWKDLLSARSMNDFLSGFFSVLCCSLLSPLVVSRITIGPNILPLVMRKLHKSS